MNILVFLFMKGSLLAADDEICLGCKQVSFNWRLNFASFLVGKHFFFLLVEFIFCFCIMTLDVYSDPKKVS